MPQPTQSQVHVDAVLSNISVAYRQRATDFIAPQVFPEVPVTHQSDAYYVYTKNDWFRDEAEERADSTESAGSGYAIGTDTYRARVWAFHKDIGFQARKNADPAIDLDRDATEFVTGRLLLRMERLWAATYFKTGVWGTDLTGVAGAPGAGQFTQWSDYAASQPVQDIAAGRRLIKVGTGYRANTLVIGYDVFETLKWHPDVRDVLKYTSAEMVTPAVLAKYFEVDRVLVADSIYATNAEGAAAAYSFIHSKGALLMHVAPSASLLTPSAGYTFAWRGVSDGLGTSVGVTRFYDPKTKSTRVEGEIAVDMKIVGADLGVFMATAVA